MKARKVKGLDPDGPLRANAERMAAVRIDELRSFADAALDPAQKRALHDMRIAAKRVRYLLELTEPCFGAAARRGAKAARRLQDLLGDIHDCDVMGERLRARAQTVALDDQRYVGLEALASYMDARRRVLHRQFVDTWRRLEADLELAP